MKAWEEYALIVNDVVQSVGVFQVGGYAEANKVAKAAHGKKAYAMNVTQIICETGDTVKDGILYHGDTPCIVLASAEEDVENLKKQMNDLADRVTRLEAAKPRTAPIRR